MPEGNEVPGPGSGHASGYHDKPPSPGDPALSSTDESTISIPIRTRARDEIERAWQHAIETGRLPELDDADRPPIEIERPANPVHGDFATNLAMRLARPYRRRPFEIATALADALAELGARGSPDAAVVAGAEAAMPGFVNLLLADAALEETVAGILSEPAGWGRVTAINPRRVNVEFVSANPTGPLTIGNARGAFIGDLLSRVLEAGGQDVTREYYFNDSGGQLDNLGASVRAIRRGQPVPDDGYLGGYVDDLAAAVPADVWADATADDAEAPRLLGRWAGGRVREGIEASLERLGVHFDVWTSEGSLHEHGWVDRAVDRLRASGHTYEQDGALWFRSTAFGDDKDRVIIRSNGRPTYFAADIGYVTEKLSRGFDHLIYIWGVDHHGTVARLRGAAEAMGYDRAAVQILLYSWVRFIRPWQDADGEVAAAGDEPARTSAGEEIVAVGDRRMVIVSMSKRSGQFITLDELLGEVGVDAARWFFASRAATTGIDFDIELAKRQSADNPVYYVQYAHARIASILRKAAAAGLEPAGRVDGLLAGAPESALARAIVRFPEVVEDAVRSEETHGVTAYATELATAFHAFYRDARVVDETEPVRSAGRLALVSAARVTLANALGLLGISAPDSM